MRKKITNVVQAHLVAMEEPSPSANLVRSVVFLFSKKNFEAPRKRKKSNDDFDVDESELFIDESRGNKSQLGGPPQKLFQRKSPIAIAPSTVQRSAAFVKAPSAQPTPAAVAPINIDDFDDDDAPIVNLLRSHNSKLTAQSKSLSGERPTFNSAAVQTSAPVMQTPAKDFATTSSNPQTSKWMKYVENSRSDSESENDNDRGIVSSRNGVPFEEEVLD